MKKSIISTGLALAMLLGMAGCTSKPQNSPEADNSGISGTFTGTSAGMQGPVTVELTINDGVITKPRGRSPPPPSPSAMKPLVWPMWP